MSKKHVFNTDQVLSLLRNAKVDIVFTKADGSDRLMKATLMDVFMPGLNGSSESNAQDNTSSTLIVWDLDEQAFRSFKISSLKSIRIGCVDVLA